jgi:hypothetical protein
MDPYLEFRASWPDFHNSLIAEIRNELGLTLPDSYVARVDERIEVATPASDLTPVVRPDVLIGYRDREATSPGAAPARATSATLEPEFMEILDRDPQRVSDNLGRNPRYPQPGTCDRDRGHFAD